MANEPRKKICVFCEVDLTKENRSNEHVIRKAWLRAFGYLDTQIHSMRSAGSSLLSTRTFQANGFVAGEVCRSCNNGWMERLDGQAEGIVLLMAMGKLQPSQLTEPVRKVLAHWALKTIFAFETTDTAERRHIPQDYRFKLRAGMFPPGSFTLQACIRAEEALGVSIVEVWPADTTGNFILGRPQSRRLKFGISFGRLVLVGSCLFDAHHAHYRAHRDWHLPIFEQSASSEFVDIDPRQACAELGWNYHMVPPQELSAVLLQPETIWPAATVFKELFPHAR